MTYLVKARGKKTVTDALATQQALPSKPRVCYELFCTADPHREEQLKAVKQYLKGCGFSRVEPAEFGTQLLDDVIMEQIEQEVDSCRRAGAKSKRVTMQVKPHLIFRVSFLSNAVIFSVLVSCC